MRSTDLFALLTPPYGEPGTPGHARPMPVILTTAEERKTCMLAGWSTGMPLRRALRMKHSNSTHAANARHNRGYDGPRLDMNVTSLP